MDTLQVKLIIPDSNEQDGCHNFTTNYNDSAILINNVNCSIDDKLRTAHLADVQLLLISGTLVC